MDEADMMRNMRKNQRGEEEIVSSKDPYGTLGASRHSDMEEVRKAHRTRSLQYHPDQCKSNVEFCNKMFQEVQNAYTALSKPLYDFTEKEFEKMKQENRGDEERAAERYQDYYGRRPQGIVQVWHILGFLVFKEAESGRWRNLFDDGDSNVFEITPDSWGSVIGTRQEPWLMLFYKSNQQTSHDITDIYNKVAEDYVGAVSVGACNCRRYPRLCNSEKIRNFPQAMWYGEDFNVEPAIFKGEGITVESMGAFMKSNMKDFSTAIATKQDAREWIDSRRAPAVAFFTHEAEPPLWWRSITREFRADINFATITGCDKKGKDKNELQALYKDVKVPGIYEISHLGATGTIVKRIKVGFIRAEVAKRMLTIKDEAAKNGPPAMFKEWSLAQREKNECAGGDDSYCFFWLKSGPDEKIQSAMNSLAEKYRQPASADKKAIKLMWVNIELNPTALDAFGLQDSDATDHFVNFSPTLERYDVMPGDLTEQSVGDFVAKILSAETDANVLIYEKAFKADKFEL